MGKRTEGELTERELYGEPPFYDSKEAYEEYEMTNTQWQAQTDKILEAIRTDQKIMKVDVESIKQELKGYDGSEGLCKRVDRNTKAINRIWVLLAVIIASLGGNVYGLLQILLGG